ALSHALGFPLERTWREAGDSGRAHGAEWVPWRRRPRCRGSGESCWERPSGSTRDRTRLVGRVLSEDASHLRLRTLDGVEVEVPRALVVGLRSATESDGRLRR